jgi:hypothetical protein
LARSHEWSSGSSSYALLSRTNLDTSEPTDRALRLRQASHWGVPEAKSPEAVDDGAENEVGTLALDAEAFEQERALEEPVGTDYRGMTTEKRADTMAWVVDSESMRAAAMRRRAHAAAAG